MEWITTKHTKSTCGKTENIHCELLLNFPVSHWNEKDKSPVIRIFYHDYKVESGWWLDDKKTKWYAYPPHKRCEIMINYFQRHPTLVLHSRTNEISYDEFTIDFCKQQAEKIFTERLRDLLNQFIEK